MESKREMTNPDYRARIYANYTTEKMGFFLSYSEVEYARNSVPMQRRLNGWLPESLQAKCVDIACGAGQTLFMLHRAGYANIVGVDISPEQVQTARRIWPQVVEGNVIGYLRQHPGEFDLVTGYDIIEHFRKDEMFELLDAIYAALRPSGRVILQTPNAESPWGTSQRYHDLTHELAFDPSSLKHALGLAGFGNFEARECGPYVHGLRSLIRTALWKVIWSTLALWNLGETGSLGSGIYTRVFIAKADRPALGSQ